MDEQKIRNEGTEEYNKLIDDYNELVDDFNRLADQLAACRPT